MSDNITYRPLIAFNGIYEGKYEIGSDGTVKSLARWVMNKGLRFRPECLLSGHVNKIGYVEMHLVNDKNECNTRKLHRLVALTFIPNPNNYDQINHIDGNKLNNAVSNLEWCDSKHNINHAESIGLRNSKGEGNAFYGKSHTDATKRKITEANGKPVIDLYTGVFYDSIAEAAILNGIKPVTLNARINRYKTEKRFAVA